MQFDRRQRARLSYFFASSMRSGSLSSAATLLHGPHSPVDRPGMLDNQPGAPITASRAWDRSQVQVFGLSCRNPLDNGTFRGQFTVMNFDRFAGLLAASFICLTLTVLAWLGIAGPIWRASYTASPEQWLGFAGTVFGAVLGAVATLSAAGIALMRSQLTELIKQNDHTLYEKLGKRALDLNNEIIMLQKVCVGCKLLDQALNEFLRETGINMNRTAFAIAFKRFTEDLESLRVTRGVIWGNERIQVDRNTFVDGALSVATLAFSFEDIAEKQRHVSELVIKRDLPKWNDLCLLVATLGNQLQTSGNIEMARIGQAMSELEKKLFA
jgi:hypothetical protein